MIKRNDAVVARSGPLQVAFYIRVSSDKQAKKLDGSLDTQLDLLKRFVEYKKASGSDWAIAEQYVEGESEGRRRGKSGKDTNRPTFQKMLAAARAQLFDVIAITRISRISRSVVDFMLLVEELDKYGVKVVSLHENIDLTTPTGKFQTILMIALAQHERETIAARVKEKVDWRAERGLPIGPPPIGYAIKDKMWIIEEKFAQHIRECDRLYLEHQSSETVAKEMARLGYRTRTGRPYSVPQICNILRNIRYAAKQPHEGELYDAQWKPIRLLKMHEQIQKVLDENAKKNHSPNRRPVEYVYLLQGLIRCGNCGYTMSPQPGIGRNGRYYPYYSCVSAEKFAGTECPFHYVPAEAADRAVLEFMKRLVLKPDLVETFAKRANEFSSDTLTKLKQDLDRVRQQLTAVRGKIANYLDAIGEGGKSAMSSVRQRLEALEAEREELESNETRLKAEYEAESEQEIVVRDQIKTLKLFDHLVRQNEDKPERIKSLLPRFIDYVIWRNRGKGEGDIQVALFPEPVALAPEVVYEGVPIAPMDSEPDAVVSSEPKRKYARQELNL